MTPWPLGEPIPSVCRIEDICRILSMSRSTFLRLDAEKKLPIVELPRMGRVRRFDGASVAQIKRTGRWDRASMRRAS